MNIIKNMLMMMVLALVAGTSSGAVVFQSDFEAQTVGGTFSAPWGNNLGMAVLLDGGQMFGGTTDNQYARLTDTSGDAGSFLRGAFSNQTGVLTTVSFDMYETVNATFNGNFVLRMGKGYTKAETNVDLRFDDGDVVTLGGTKQTSTGAYTLDAMHHVDVVINNNTGSSATYHGSETLANNRYDVWIDGVKVIDGAEYRTATVTKISRINFLSFSSDIVEMNFDNVVIRDEAFVFDARMASDPDPYHEEIDVPVSKTLKWKAGLDLVTGLQRTDVEEYYLYIGDPNLPATATAVVPEIGDKGGQYTPASELARDKDYAWRVDEKLNNGTIVIGRKWKFETVPSTPAIDVDFPVDQYAYAGTDVEFTVVATNTFTGHETEVSYQWYLREGETDTALTAGATFADVDTDVLTITDVQIADEGAYFCRVTNTYGNNKYADSRTARLVVKRAVGHWPFDDNSNDVIAGNNGITETTTYEPGQPDLLNQKSIRFYGYDGDERFCVKIDAVPYADLDTFTLTWWEWTHEEVSVQKWDTMVALGNGEVQATLYPTINGGVPFEYGTHYGGIYVYIDGIADFEGRNLNDYQGKGQWHFHGMAFDGVKFRRFIDGIQMNYPGSDGTRDGNEDHNFKGFDKLGNKVIWVGNEDDTDGDFNNALNARIDDLKIYNFSMDRYEVADAYVVVTGNTVCPLAIAEADGDFNRDCQINLVDFAELFSQWMVSNRFYGFDDEE